jgi:hypothetical protein
MKRTQIYLPEDAAEELQAVATAEGRSVAAVVRDAVQEYVAKSKPDPANNPLLELIGLAGPGGPPDAAERHDDYLYGDHDDDKHDDRLR